MWSNKSNHFVCMCVIKISSQVLNKTADTKFPQIHTNPATAENVHLCIMSQCIRPKHIKHNSHGLSSSVVHTQAHRPQTAAIAASQMSPTFTLIRPTGGIQSRLSPRTDPPSFTNPEPLVKLVIFYSAHAF